MNASDIQRPSFSSSNSKTHYVVSPQRNGYDDVLSCNTNGHIESEIFSSCTERFDDEVKQVLDRLVATIDKSLRQRIDDSQIVASLSSSMGIKRSSKMNNDGDCSLSKKVRCDSIEVLNISDDEPTACLFITETLACANHSQHKPYANFLHYLGFDLCLEQNLMDDSCQLSTSQKETLIERNRVFHPRPIRSCKYCSFQTDTMHVMDRHHRTPHRLSKRFHRTDKFRCTYCLFHTFHLSELRRHLNRKHKHQLINEPMSHRYSCVFCQYETDDKMFFMKHNIRCELEQERTCLANDLLESISKQDDNKNKPISTINPVFFSTTNQTRFAPIQKLSQQNSIAPLNDFSSTMNPCDEFEPIIIESDNDSTSDEDFHVNANDESSSTTDSDSVLNRDFELTKFMQKKPLPNSRAPLPTNLHAPSSSSAQPPLSDGARIPVISGKTTLISMQPKLTNLNDTHKLCHVCQHFVLKSDYAKHLIEKHQPCSTTTSTPVLNKTTTNSTVPIAVPDSALSSAPMAANPTMTILLLSTAAMEPGSISLNMIKCPWCDTKFEHIDIMVGHLMRYHRMTLPAAKVIVAEQMKLQGTSANQLSLLFKTEIERIQQEFNDKIYWKISQPKVYLHQIENLSCFVCKMMIDDLEQHFISCHQTQLTTLMKIDQCCLCGIRCDSKKMKLLEHQLRMHGGVCYSSVLKQFIRFEPAPVPKNVRPIQPTPKTRRPLTTLTEKKFGCRKCETDSRLFTFDELIEHLRQKHQLNVKLHRRCPICQQTFVKGKEFNEHCLTHMLDETPTIQLRRHLKIF